jgi:tRNA threonylcarbamoyladenosine biosynthesis protein TsaE
LSIQVINTNSYEETFSLGQKLGAYIKTNLGLKVGFTGDLGAGKTLFIKGVFSKILPDIVITSPTYAIMDEYEYKGKNLYHVDLYRIESISDLFGTGFIEALENEKSTMFIEWLEKMKDSVYFDSKFITIDIAFINENKRKITIKNLEVNL